MKKLNKNIKKIIIICAGFLAIMVLIICGQNACDEKMEKDFQEYRKLLAEDFEERNKVYAMAEKNVKTVTESLNRVISYIQKHPEIIEELKNYDWSKLKRYEPSLDENKLAKTGFKTVKLHFESGSVIELYKLLISENEQIAAFMKDAHYGRSYYDSSTSMGDPFYQRLRSFVIFTHSLALSIMKELGHNPYKATQ